MYMMFNRQPMLMLDLRPQHMMSSTGLNDSSLKLDYDAIFF